jgi:hypothetical protein
MRARPYLPRGLLVRPGGGKQSVRAASSGGMPARPTTALAPLTLAEQLDAMLSGWLERYARTHDDPGGADARATAVVAVARSSADEVEAFCERWDLAVERTERDDGSRVVLLIEGRALPVRGFTEITGM